MDDESRRALDDVEVGDEVYVGLIGRQQLIVVGAFGSLRRKPDGHWAVCVFVEKFYGESPANFTLAVEQIRTFRIRRRAEVKP